MVNLLPNPSSSFHPLIVICFIQLPLLLSASGFTVDLIHRDSPQSPFYNASKTHSDRLRDAIIRSYSRAAYLKKAVSKTKQNFEAPVLPTEFEYVVKLSIGTPSTSVYGIIDTGSDLSWIQCSPCVDCYKQDYPLFDPKKSSTYKPVLCSSDTCTTLGGATTSCISNGNKCQYQTSYGDGSTSNGEVAFETFTFGTTSVPDLIFGCGHNDRGMFTSTETGIIGLGGGKGSFATQLNSSINGKFSYCFTHNDPKANTTGKISFGDDAIVSGPGAVSTPIVRLDYPDFYMLTIENIKLGNKTFPYRSTTTSGMFKAVEGNVIIDSGTTLTFLPDELVTDLQSELRKTIKAKQVPDPQGNFALCYDKSVKIDGPAITLQFTGAAIEIPQAKAFTETDQGLFCLGIISDNFSLPILGNRLQENFLVGYDTVTNKVSFKPTDCSKL